MLRWFVCLAISAAVVGDDVLMFAASPQTSGFDCRVADHRPKRLRRLGNRMGTKHPAAIVQLDDETTTEDDRVSAPAAAPNGPVRLNATGGWKGAAAMDFSRDESDTAAALFPVEAPPGPNK